MLGRGSGPCQGASGRLSASLRDCAAASFLLPFLCVSLWMSSWIQGASGATHTFLLLVRDRLQGDQTRSAPRQEPLPLKISQPRRHLQGKPLLPPGGVAGQLGRGLSQHSPGTERGSFGVFAPPGLWARHLHDLLPPAVDAWRHNVDGEDQPQADDLGSRFDALAPLVGQQALQRQPCAAAAHVPGSDPSWGGTNGDTPPLLSPVPIPSPHGAV